MYHDMICNIIYDIMSTLIGRKYNMAEHIHIYTNAYERKKNIYIYIHVHMYTYMYIYIFNMIIISQII